MNTAKITLIQDMSNHEITQSIDRTFKNERQLQADFLVLLSEISSRRLHIHLGYSSLMVYCVEHFGLTEFSAYKRMQIARAAKNYPGLIEAIRNNETNLTVAAMIAPQLKRETAAEQMKQCAGKSKGQVKKIIAGWNPQPDVKESIRHMKPSGGIPKAETSLENPAPAPNSKVSHQNFDDFFSEPNTNAPTKKSKEEMKPLSAESTSIRFCINAKTEEKLKRAQELLGKESMADVFDRALDALLQIKDPIKREERRAKKAQGKTADTAQKEDKKIIPAVITPKLKDRVLTRANHQCTYVSPEGKRCCERRNLEVEHIRPRGKDGSNSDSNLTILCKSHNLYRAQLHYGKNKILSFAGKRSTM
jgi:hypothetical protein